MNQILTLHVVGDPEGTLRTFTFHGYGDPTEVSRSETYGYCLNDPEPDALPVWYLNSNGFAQKLNPARRPYRKPNGNGDRVLLIPNFQEVVCMTFQQLLEDNDFSTRSYSGRGMFSKECLAVTVEDIVKGTWDIATMLAEYNSEAKEFDTEEIPEPRGMRYDNMGLKYVIYWTQVPYEGSDEPEEDEES